MSDQKTEAEWREEIQLRTRWMYYITCAVKGQKPVPPAVKP